MALVQAVQDGKLVDTSASSTTVSSEKGATNNGLDKDAFLQLLVAQMKYQDPLQPTDNTEYISQLATFTQLEETQNVQDTLTQSQANDLVGKTVIMQSTSTSGVTNTVTGVVDFVRYENGKTYLSVNDKLYNIDDLQMVADTDYMDAITLASTFKTAVASLPGKSQLTISDGEKVEKVRTMFDSLTDYQKEFIDQTDYAKFLEIEERMNELKKVAEAEGEKAEEQPEETEDKDVSDVTETTESTE